MSSQKFKDSQKGKIRDLRRNLPDIKAQGIERPSKKRKTTADRRDDAIATATVENDSHDQQDSPAQAPPSKKLKTSEAVSENETTATGTDGIAAVDVEAAIQGEQETCTDRPTAVLTSTSSALAEYPLNLPGWDVDEDLDMHVTVDERLPINTLRVVDASRVVNDVCMFDEPRVVTNQRLIIKDNQRLYDLPRLFNGPQIIIGRGKEPHIIDLTSVFMWYELSFTVGTDDTINSAELWDWMANTIANPPVPGIFEQEHERRSVVIGLINEVYEANAYGHGDYSTLYRKVEVQRKNGSWTIDMEFGEKTPKEQKEIVTKWLSKLKKEDDRLTHRPHSWIVRLADYDHIVHHHKFKPEADINHEDLDESLPLKVAGDAFLESLPVDSFCDMWGLLQPTTAADLTAEASSGDEEEDEVYVSAFDYDAEEDC